MAKPLTLKQREQAKIQLAEGDSHRSVARSLGKAPLTIKRFAVKNVAEIEAHRSKLADIAEDIALRCWDGIPDKNIEKMGTYQRVLTGSIAIDKASQIRGFSKENAPVVQILINHDPRVVPPGVCWDTSSQDKKVIVVEPEED